MKLFACLLSHDYSSQPYSTTGNITVLYILIFKFLERSLEDKRVALTNCLRNRFPKSFKAFCPRVLSLNGPNNSLYNNPIITMHTNLKLSGKDTCGLYTNTLYY